MARSSVDRKFRDLCQHLGYQESRDFYQLDEDELPMELTKTKEKVGVDAVYGVSIEDKGYVPLVYFKKYSSYDENEIKEIYKRIWNEGKVSLLILVLPDKIKIYNTSNQPPLLPEEDLDTEDRLLNILDLTGKALDQVKEIEEYDISELESREFWKKRKDKFTDKNKVDKHLMKNLEQLRKTLQKHDGIKQNEINNLIIRSIFILYLEDRGIIDDHYYEGHDFSEKSYREILPDIKGTYDLFDCIKDSFNGDIFEYEYEERKDTNEIYLEKLKKFLNGVNLETGQTRLFPYKFDIIPIEMISSIYERFVSSEAGDGVYYTPQSLAYFMVNELNEIDFESDIKVLDPACGSGIFLVNTFGKFIERLKLKNELGKNSLLDILENNLFGIDKSNEAVKITAFSLYLKLLENLDKDEIEEIRLPTLIDRTLIPSDFFDLPDGFKDEKFDLIIGNPPWGNAGSNNKNAIRYCKDRERPVSRKQLAQCFLWKILDHAKPSTKVCFLIPTKSIFLNKFSDTFRDEYFKTIDIDTIINLSLIRDELFEKAVHPSAILKYDIGSKSGKNIEYITPKYIISNIIQSIIVDNNDIKYISQEKFNRKSAKILMYGGIRDLEILNKLENFVKLKDICEQFGIKNREGIIINGPDKYKEGHHHPEIAELPHMKTSKFRSYFINENKLTKLNEEYFERYRERDIFLGPKLLVKEGISRNIPRIKAAYTEKNISFTDSIISFTNDKNYKSILKILNLLLNSSLVEYYVFMTSSNWGVERAKANKTEILDIPCIIPSRDSKKFDNLLSLHSDIKSMDMIKRNYMGIREMIDNKLFDLFEIKENERKLIEDRLRYTVNYFNDRRKSFATNRLTSEIIEEYAKTISGELNKLFVDSEYSILPIRYVSDDEYYLKKELPLNLVSFKISEKQKEIDVKEAKEDLSKKIQEINQKVYKKESSSIFFQRKKVVVDKDTVHIIKPNEIRFWTNAEALNDSNEILGELIEQGQSE